MQGADPLAGRVAVADAIVRITDLAGSDGLAFRRVAFGGGEQERILGIWGVLSVVLGVFAGVWGLMGFGVCFPLGFEDFQLGGRPVLQAGLTSVFLAF